MVGVYFPHKGDNMAELKKNKFELPPEVLRALLFNSSLLGRRASVGEAAGIYSQFDGARNIREVAGYPTDITFDDFYSAYQRQDIATRVVETYPDYTWLSAPTITDTMPGLTTPFTIGIGKLFGNKKVLSRLRALDVLAGIGEYGVMIIGVNDGKEIDQPLKPRDGLKISYMRAYTEGEAKIIELETNRFSPRYMQPVMYEITPNELKQAKGTKMGKAPGVLASFKVHHSRVIHFADNALNSETHGVPRLRRVYDRLLDILKVVAGSSEMFWRGAYQGFSFEADSDGELGEEDRAAMREDIQNYLMGLDRAMLLQGVKTNPIAPAVVSPKDHLDAQLTMVAIASRIPKRILTGSEMGKLASVQDAENWALQIDTRRVNTVEPDLLRPFIDFCLTNRILPACKDDQYEVKWHKLSLPTDKDTSETALNFTNALSTFASAGLYTVMDFKDYLVNVWKYDEQNAEKLSNGFDATKFEKLAKTQTKGIQTPKNTKTTTVDT